MENIQILNGIYNVDFINSTAYPVNSLRGVLNSLATKGVLGSINDSLKVIKLNENSLKVLSGSAIFADGGVIKIDSEGEIMQFSSLGTYYVYLNNSVNDNEKGTKISSDMPNGDFVLLAQIIDGSFIDRRNFSKLKQGEA